MALGPLDGGRLDWNRLGGMWTGSMVWIRGGESDRGMTARFFLRWGVPE